MRGTKKKQKKKTTKLETGTEQAKHASLKLTKHKSPNRRHDTLSNNQCMGQKISLSCVKIPLKNTGDEILA